MDPEKLKKLQAASANNRIGKSTNPATRNRAKLGDNKLTFSRRVSKPPLSLNTFANALGHSCSENEFLDVEETV